MKVTDIQYKIIEQRKTKDEVFEKKVILTLKKRTFLERLLKSEKLKRKSLEEGL